MNTAQLTANLPDLSTWVFYAANVALVSAYLVVIALLLRKGGFTGRGQMSPTNTTMCVLFLLACCLLHIELAVNAWQRTLVVQGGTGVDVHLTLVVVVKAMIVVIGLAMSYRHTQRLAETGEEPAAAARVLTAVPLEITEAHIRRALIDDAQVAHTSRAARDGAEVPAPRAS